MTGRSTEANDLNEELENAGYSRHSVALESLTTNMERQTEEVSKLMRHSIAHSFSSKFNVSIMYNFKYLVMTCHTSYMYAVRE